MAKDILYDHAYTLDRHHKFLKGLERLGFSLAPHTVEHPGKAFCRFIIFSDPKRNKRHYLEFVDVRDKKAEKQRGCPGLSFRYEKDLESYYKKLKKKRTLHPTFDHKNYNWKENSKDRLPGWNFMHFKKRPTRNIFPWFTEYEPHPSRAKRFKKTTHPNGALEVVRIEIFANEKGKKFFSDVLGAKITESISLKKGVNIHFQNSKTNQMNRILVRVRSLKKFEKFIPKSNLKVESTARGFLIKNPYKLSNMYDLEIVE